MSHLKFYVSVFYAAVVNHNSI